MDFLDVAGTANELGLPIETVRLYGDRFALFVPALRTGAQVRYPADGVQLLGEIDQAVQAGTSFEEIESALQHHIPVTYVATGAPLIETPPSSPVIDELLSHLDQQRDAVLQDIDALRTAMERLTTIDDFHTLRAETASLAALLVQRDARLQHAAAVDAAELREALAALRREIAELHANVRDERQQLTSLAAMMASDSPQPGSAHDRPTDQPASSDRRTIHRTPRRMGQPLRVNGLTQT